MKRATGLVIGEFLPFHLGHEALVRWAKVQVEQLYVLVGHKPNHSVPGEIRAEWIKTLHPDVQVLLVADDLPPQPEPWAKRTLEVLGFTPDLVFSSEDYGLEYARLMGSEHKLFDRNRSLFPISGTLLRADLRYYWHMLTPPAKAFFTKRIIILGVDSSGTTTLAKDLASAYNTVCVPEYGRELWEYKKNILGNEDDWTSADFLEVAYIQSRLEDDLASQSRCGILVCDTDALATHVWHRRYLGSYSQTVWDFIISRKKPDLYILTKPDFAFIQDGTREEDERNRLEMHQWFIETLTQSTIPWIQVTGDYFDRIKQATKVIDPLLKFPKFIR